MATMVEQLKPQLGALSEPERAELAQFLLSSLEEREEGAAEAWQAEITRRVADIRSGQAKGTAASEVFTELRERFP